jgi:excinuclease UvrABC helicase subunit UvrB
MSQEILLENLLKQASSKTVIGNGSIFETLQEINKAASEVDKILAVAEKYKLLDPLRLYFIKKHDLGSVKEVGQSPGIEPPSETHRIAYLELNKYSEEDLKKVAAAKGKTSNP